MSTRRPYFTVRRRLAEQLLGATAASVDLRHFKADDAFRDLVFDVRDVRERAWKLATETEWPQDRDHRREWMTRAANAEHRLRVRAGLEEREEWRLVRDPGYYSVELEDDLRTVFAWRDALR